MDKRYKHNMRHSIEYNTWCSIKARCYNVNSHSYKHYGAKGINMSLRWQESFSEFFNDMGNRPLNTSIDRIDNNKGYFKENCRWATKSEQANNRRTAHIISYNGQTGNLKTLCKMFNMDYRGVWQRIKRGWDINKSFETPLQCTK